MGVETALIVAAIAGAGYLGYESIQAQKEGAESPDIEILPEEDVMVDEEDGTVKAESTRRSETTLQNLKVTPTAGAGTFTDTGLRI